MIRTLFIRTIGCISIRSFYPEWIRASGSALVLSVATLVSGDSWLVTVLILALAILLAGGILLLVFGIRDLIRDFRRFLHLRSEKKSHA